MREREREESFRQRAFKNTLIIDACICCYKSKLLVNNIINSFRAL